MEIKESKSIYITDQSQVSEIRLIASSMAANIGLNEASIGKLSIIVSEIASNLVKHTFNGGEIILNYINKFNLEGIEIISIDKEPGMKDINKCLEDGFSTKGSQGGGLGAVRRLSDEFDIYSQPEQGTIIMARIWKPAIAYESFPELLTVAGINKSKEMEHVSGDCYAVNYSSTGCKFFISDGLGHGEAAFNASKEASKIFQNNYQLDISDLLTLIHNNIGKTRGAAVAISELNVFTNTVIYAGVGNIEGIVIDPDKSRRMVSHFGIVGHQMNKIQKFTYEWGRESILILNTDGLKIKWDWENYPGITLKHPAIIAGILYRDYSRNSDDATIVVAKNN